MRTLVCHHVSDTSADSRKSLKTINGCLQGCVALLADVSGSGVPEFLSSSALRQRENLSFRILTCMCMCMWSSFSHGWRVARSGSAVCL